MSQTLSSRCLYQCHEPYCPNVTQSLSMSRTQATCPDFTNSILQASYKFYSCHELYFLDVTQSLSTSQTLATCTNLMNSVFKMSHYFYQFHELDFLSVKRSPSMSRTPATYKIDMHIGRVLTEIFWGLSDANHMTSGNNNYWASWHKFKVCWAFHKTPKNTASI